MRRIIALAALLGGLAASGVSAASTPTQPTRIVFGVGGGNMVPYQVVIAATGTVRASGGPRVTRKHLSTSTVLRLDGEVRSAFASGVTSRLCRGTNPDVGSDFITLGRRTVRVHGSCEPRFSRLWKALATAVGLRFG